MTHAAVGMSVGRIARGAAFLAILLVAVWLRLTSATQTTVDHPIRNDAKDYVAYSFNWKYLDVYSRQVTWVPGHEPDRLVPDAFRPPGYPLFLRLFLNGEPDLEFVQRVMLAQAGLGIATVLLVFGLARLLLGTTAALFAMAFAAVSPHLVIMENYLLTETLFAVLLAVACAAGAVALQGPRPRPLWAVVVGAVLALCALVRPTMGDFVWVAFIASAAVPGMRLYRKAAFGAMLAFAVVMAPWWSRNLADFQHISDSSLMITTVHHGSYPGLMYQDDPKSLGVPYAYDSHAKNAETSLGSAIADVWQRARERPGKYLWWYAVGKVAMFFNWDIVDGWDNIFTYQETESPYYDNPVFRISYAIMLSLHWLLVIAGLLGAIVVWTRLAPFADDDWKLKAARWLSMLLLYAVALHMIVAPFPRYSIPFRPLLYILAVLAQVTCFRWIATWRRGQRA